MVLLRLWRDGVAPESVVHGWELREDCRCRQRIEVDLLVLAATPEVSPVERPVRVCVICAAHSVRENRAFPQADVEVLSVLEQALVVLEGTLMPLSGGS